MEALWFLDYDLDWGLKDLNLSFFLVNTSLLSEDSGPPHNPSVHHGCRKGGSHSDCRALFPLELHALNHR